jgi:hypothetical protein
LNNWCVVEQHTVPPRTHEMPLTNVLMGQGLSKSSFETFVDVTDFGRSAHEIAADLTRAFDEHCAST